MNLRIFLQGFLLITIISILLAFYYSFLAGNSTNNDNASKNEKLSEINTDKKIANELTNVEYNSTDRYGNTFYLNAERAYISLEAKPDNKVNLESVVSIINLKNKGIINIYSQYATYDKLNHNTLFSENVKIEYLDNLIESENLDILFTKNISTIYSNVVYKNNNLNLSTDIILIDMESGDIKLKMLNNNKVNLITKYEFIN